MEPKLDDSNEKGAPIVIWSNDSPTKNPSSPSSELYQTPTGEIKSNGSSGIGKDSPERTATSESVTYSPALSSFGEDPNLTDSPVKNYSDFNYSNNNIPLKNGDVYLPEGVKFLDGGCLAIAAKDDSICSSGSSDESEEKKPKVPDGGWGWVVVLSSLVISMIADGISFSFGLLYIEFLNHFEASKSRTAWIGSLFMAVPLLSGPIMSALVDRYGCKNMTMLGGTISALGFILSCFANSIEYLLITFGVIAGIGLGLCYVTAVVSIAYWFDKYRTLATGLGACGTGVGTFVYAPMTQFFIDEYGWRGTILLLAGTFLNMCVCGAVMRDPEWWVMEQNKQHSLSGTKSIRNASSCGSISGMDGESQFPGTEEIRNMLKSGQSPEYILTTLVTSINETPQIEKEKEEEAPLPTFRSVVNLPTFVRQSEKVPLEVLQQLSSNTKIFNVILENYPSLLTCRSMSDNGKLNQIPPDVVTKRVPLTMSMRLKAHKKKTSTTMAPTTILEHTSMENIETCATPLLPIEAVIPGVILKPTEKALPALPYPRRQMSVKDTGQHYLKHIRVHRNSVMYRGATLNIPRYHLRASSCPNIYRNSMTTIARDDEEKWYAETLEFCKGMFDFSMFLEFHFQLMSWATILLFVWFIVPYFYLAEHLTRNGYTEQEASHLISIIGVTNCLGMVGLGWAGDQPWMHVTKTYSVCLVLCGLMCILMPFSTSNYYLLGVNCALFGLFFASNYSFTPTILVELIPLERFTTAYGLILLCQGIGNLLGPPLAGWLFDVTGSWDLSFYMAGLWIIVAGILMAIIPVTKNRKIWGSGMLEMDRISNA